MALWMIGIICSVSPSVNPISLRVSLQTEDFNDAVPYRLSLERLYYGYALKVLGLCAVQMMNHAP